MVKVFIDGAQVATGNTWEDYYRYDPESAGSGNKLPAVDNLILLGARYPACMRNGGQGIPG